MFVRHRLAWLADLIVLIALVPMQATCAHWTATVPEGFSDSLYAGNFAGRLTSTTFGPDGRLYVSEKAGRVRIVDHGTLPADAFLTTP